MIQPINRTVANDYRQALGVADAPQMIDTEIPITPVLLVNNSFPKPSTSQKLKYFTVGIHTALTSYQIATASSTTKIYFIGIKVINGGAVALNPAVFDGTSGNSPAIAANTTYADGAGLLANPICPATNGTQDETILPLPVQVNNGIRLTMGGAAQAGVVIIYYIEEIVT
jgi:hypothetical protein